MYLTPSAAARPRSSMDFTVASVSPSPQASPLHIGTRTWVPSCWIFFAIAVPWNVSFGTRR